MVTREEALQVVLAEIDREPGGPFALDAMMKVVGRVPPLPRMPLEVFMVLMKKVVAAAVELVIIRNGRVLLTRREKGDPYFQGLHTPGTYMGVGETLIETAQRCADRELGVKILNARVIGGFSSTDSPRFHDFSALTLCEIEGDPREGEWHDTCPGDIIPVHRPFWDVIRRRLGKKVSG